MKSESIMIVCKKCKRPFMAFSGLNIKPADQPCPHCESEKGKVG